MFERVDRRAAGRGACRLPGGEAAARERKDFAEADRLRDEVTRRFGTGSLTRASLLGRRERRNPSDKPPD